LPTGYTNGINNGVTRPAVDPAHNITAALATHPDAVIINLPSNDATSGFSEAETETNFLILVAACQASNVPVWIGSTQPRNLGTTGQNVLINEKNWILSAWPKQSLDFWTTIANPNGSLNAAYDSGDGVHLNNAGHQILYNRVVASRLYELIGASRTLNVQPVFYAVNVGFNTVTGINYVVEWSTDLVGWQTLTNTIGTGTLVSQNVPATNTSAYFRLVLEPAP
jgi:hypothetical protein